MRQKLCTRLRWHWEIRQRFRPHNYNMKTRLLVCSEFLLLVKWYSVGLLADGVRSFRVYRASEKLKEKNSTHLSYKSIEHLVYRQAVTFSYKTICCFMRGSSHINLVRNNEIRYFPWYFTSFFFFIFLSTIFFLQRMWIKFYNLHWHAIDYHPIGSRFLLCRTSSKNVVLFWQ